MSTVFTRVDVIPSYSRGFAFTWEVSQGLADVAPWRFTVEQAPSPDGPWTALSPVITGKYSWAEAGERRINKAQVLYFRIKLVTATATYASDVRTPYGDLNRREFLIAREIMRKELLHMRKGAGTRGQLWLVSTYGPKCSACINPITGGVRDSKCGVCRGTGRNPPYHGPYDIWATFTPAQITAQMGSQPPAATEPKQFQVRMIGAPPVKKNDLVIDTASDKRYYVDVVQEVAELRRVPVVQSLTVNEAAVTDAAYKVTAP